MDPDRWKRIDGIFQSAFGMTAAERDRYVAVECAGDKELERDVRHLLDCHNDAGSFLDRPAYEAEDAEDSILEPDGTMGHYRVIEKLGSGGMGVVYKAEDTRLHRFAAIKFLSGGMMANPDSLSRFRREAR